SAEKEKDMIHYFAKKVENYRLQDRKANRSIDDASFVTKEWLMGASASPAARAATASPTPDRTGR
ncbi:MAG: hypothetical protein ACKPKO_45245, partial [Candidatus Fonsibacter sp.]